MCAGPPPRRAAQVGHGEDRLGHGEAVEGEGALGHVPHSTEVGEVVVPQPTAENMHLTVPRVMVKLTSATAGCAVPW